MCGINIFKLMLTGLKNMTDKTIFIWIGLFIGSLVGSHIPNLWGIGILTPTSLVFGTIGSFVGIWCGCKFNEIVDI